MRRGRQRLREAEAVHFDIFVFLIFVAWRETRTECADVSSRRCFFQIKEERGESDYERVKGEKGGRRETFLILSVGSCGESRGFGLFAPGF